MRVAFYGNICNNFYQIARALREQYGWDAHLYLDENGGQQLLPESDDPELVHGYPAWIHVTPNSVRYLLTPWLSPLIREWRGYDALVVSGMGPMLAQFAPLRTAFYATGSDLTIYPFSWRYQSLYKSWPKKLGQVVRGFWQRRGILRCTKIWANAYKPFTDALKLIGADSGRVSNIYFPLLLDIERFQPRRPEELSPLATSLRRQHKFIVFHPSRLMIRDEPLLRYTGDWKANDQLLRGFAQFVRSRPEVGAVLVLIDRPESRDMRLAQELIESWGIQHSVVWLQPPQQEGFKRHELVDLYAAADVVADDFGAGWFGSVVLEALAVGRPVINYLDPEVVPRFYPWNPIVEARTANEIARGLARLADNPEWRTELGVRSRAWIEEFHSHRGAVQNFVRGLRELVEA